MWTCQEHLEGLMGVRSTEAEESSLTAGAESAHPSPRQIVLESGSRGAITRHVDVSHVLGVRQRPSTMWEPCAALTAWRVWRGHPYRSLVDGEPARRRDSVTSERLTRYYGYCLLLTCNFIAGYDATVALICRCFEDDLRTGLRVRQSLARYGRVRLVHDI